MDRYDERWSLLSHHEQTQVDEDVVIVQKFILRSAKIQPLSSFIFSKSMENIQTVSYSQFGPWGPTMCSQKDHKHEFLFILDHLGLGRLQVLQLLEYPFDL